MADAKEFEQHYVETMGGVPESLSALAEESREVFEGYSELRMWLLRPDDTETLPLKYRHLMLSLLDCAGGNLGGARNHARAAMNRGATAPEVRDAMLLLIIACGMPAWGGFGRRVVDMARGLTDQDGMSAAPD